MKNSIALITLALIFCAGCATIHGTGKYAVPIEGKISSDKFKQEIKSSSKNRETPKKLIVSGSENTSLASEYFTLLDFTFENKSSEWRRVKSVALDFGDEKANKEIRFPAGQDLLEWAESANRVRAIKNYNMSMIASAIGGAGVVASGSNSKSTRRGGQTAAIGSGMVLSSSSLSKKLNRLQRANVIPKDHLLSGQFSIPPGLHAKKWLTLYAKSPLEIPYVSKLAMTLTYDDGSKESLLMKFRTAGSSGSKFQKNHETARSARSARNSKKSRR